MDHEWECAFGTKGKITGVEPTGVPDGLDPRTTLAFSCTGFCQECQQRGVNGSKSVTVTLPGFEALTANKNKLTRMAENKAVHQIVATCPGKGQ